MTSLINQGGQGRTPLQEHSEFTDKVEVRIRIYT